MTYKELIEKLQKLTPEQLEYKVKVYNSYPDEFFSEEDIDVCEEFFSVRKIPDKKSTFIPFFKMEDGKVSCFKIKKPWGRNSN